MKKPLSPFTTRIRLKIRGELFGGGTALSPELFEKDGGQIFSYVLCQRLIKKRLAIDIEGCMHGLVDHNFNELS